MPSENMPVLAEKHIIAPLGTPEQLLDLLEQYEKLKAKIVRSDDLQKIQGKDFLKKSYWRRIAKCFGLSLSLDKEWKENNEDGSLTFYAVYTATAPNGQSCAGDGACSTAEKGLEKSHHNARATAHTRAKNRAISDLVGGGEVSAEEINGDHQPSKSPTEKDLLISPAQAKRLFAVAKSKGYNNEAIKAHLVLEYGLEHSKDIKRESYEQVVEDFSKGTALKGNEIQ